MGFQPGNYRGRAVHPTVLIDQRRLWFFTFAYKRRAKRKGLAVTISESEFIKLVTSDCHYCGKSWQSETRRVNKVTVPMATIDRKDPKKGYVLNNCVPCCKVCNTIKMDMGYNEFKVKLAQIHKHLNLGSL